MTDSEREALIEQWADGAVGMARRYRTTGLDRDDLEQVSMLGLIRAARRFDPTVIPVDKFWSYAKAYCHGAIQEFIRAQSPVTVSRREKSPPVAAPQAIDLFAATDDDPHDEHANMIAITQDALGRLTELERKVVGLVHGIDGGGGMTVRKSAEKLGYSYQLARDAYTSGCLTIATYCRLHGLTDVGACRVAE